MRKSRQLSVSVGDFNQDNEFMQGSKKVQVSSSRPHISKDERIVKLEQRNVRLQEEVIRIQRALSAIEDKTTYGIHLPQIKSDVIRKELQNAYKKIKQYQYEIAKRKKLDLEGAYVDHLRKYERSLREKEQISERLRKDILQTKKQTTEYTKLLKDDTLKKQYSQKERKLNADIKWLHEKIKKQQQKKNQLNMNLQKQQELAQKIQKDLIQQNYSKQFIENLRNKYLNRQISTNVDEDEEDIEIQPTEARDIDLDDRSPEIYEVLMGEIRLYRKLQNDYEQKISLLTRQKDQSEQRNLVSRNKLLQVQYEIEKVETRIAELKTQMDPKAMIPTHIEALREQARRFNSVKKITKPKITMAHLFRFAEIGEATKDGKRFIDRNPIGKKVAKIVGVTYFQSKEGQRLLGLQATYLIGKAKKQGLTNLLCSPEKVQERHFQVEQGDYVKTIDCLQDDKGLIVGMAMVTVRNQILRGGVQTDNRKSIDLTPTQIPVCIYGSLLQNGVEMLGTEAIPSAE